MNGKEILKIILRQIRLARLLTKTLKVNKAATNNFSKICRSQPILSYWRDISGVKN